METTEKKTYNNAPLADREYYAKPRWHEVGISEKSGNLCLTVLWDVCDKDGHPGNFDMATGEETSLPAGMDSWEAASKTYVIAYAEESANLIQPVSHPGRERQRHASVRARRPAGTAGRLPSFNP